MQEQMSQRSSQMTLALREGRMTLLVGVAYRMHDPGMSVLGAESSWRSISESFIKVGHDSVPRSSECTKSNERGDGSEHYQRRRP